MGGPKKPTHLLPTVAVMCCAALLSACANANMVETPASIASIPEAPQATGGELAGTLLGGPPSTGPRAVVQAATDLIKVPFAGHPCQSLPISDFGKLKMAGTRLAVRIQVSAKSLGQTTDPANAAGIGCSWNMTDSGGRPAGSVSVFFESAADFRHHQMEVVPATPRPTGLPAGSFSVGHQVEAAKNGYYFSVIAINPPWDQEEGAIAAAVLGHL